MLLLFLHLLAIALSFAAAQNGTNPMIVCWPGMCIQGYTSIAFGARLMSPASPVPMHLLLGQYTMQTSPQLLHNALSSSPVLTSSAGLPDTLSVPFDLALEPGMAIFSDSLYAGQTAFTPLSASSSVSNSSLPLTFRSFSPSSAVVAILTSSQDHIVIWDPIPDTQQLPISLSQLSLASLQSSACSPACSSGGTCSADGQCVCSDGFAGSSCENCAPGYFGPTCQQCGCGDCDDGISGIGLCKTAAGGNLKACNCLNGACGSDGQCKCIDGFTKADNGTQCAKCADGFFQSSDGACKVCQAGCTQCAPTTGVCLGCASGLEKDPSDPTKCRPLPQPKIPDPPSNKKEAHTTEQQCPLGAVQSDGRCLACDPTCTACVIGVANRCTACADGLYLYNGTCIKANDDGICDGTTLIADNVKGICDTCGARCASCKIPNFNKNSVVNDIECTQCIPGSLVSNTKCIDACSTGSFLSPRDNITCQPCDSSCTACVNSPTFCLSCSGAGQLAANGKCVSAASCPDNTFVSPSVSSCLSCHPDCATCSGSRFDQCNTCPPSRPVLSGGRCLTTCAKNEFWDSGAKSCRQCDSSCGTCSGPDPTDCLSCSNASDRTLQSGSCVTASCKYGTPVVSPLGVCLSDLVVVPQSSNTSATLAPLPTVTGIDKPTTVTPAPSPSHGKRLAWWQILLMALGGVFIVLGIAQCQRRWARRRREQRRRLQAHVFANLAGPGRWWTLPDEKEAPVYEQNPVDPEEGGGGGELPTVEILPPVKEGGDAKGSMDDINQVLALYENPDLKAPPPAAKGNDLHHHYHQGPYPMNEDGYPNEKMAPEYGYQYPDDFYRVWREVLIGERSAGP